MFRRIQTLLACLLVGTARLAHAIDLQDGHATVEIRTTEHRGQLQMRFADELTVVLKVSGPRVEVEVDPRRFVLSPDWRVEAEPAESAMGRWEQTFRLAPLKPGPLPIPLAPWRYRIDGGEWQRTRWRPVTVDVISQADSDGLAKPRDITSIESPSPVPAAPAVWPWLVAGGVALALGFVGWRVRRGPLQATAKSKSPESAALAHLDRLAARRWGASERGDRFGTLLSLILRRYLSRRYHVSARRQTTQELHEALTQHAKLQAHASYLVEICERCDAARFANEPLPLPQANEMLAHLQGWIRARAQE